MPGRSARIPAPTEPSSGRALRPVRRASALVTIAALALVIGHADLARGGTTWAAVLLVLGYCALVPAAILEGARTGTRSR